MYLSKLPNISILSILCVATIAQGLLFEQTQPLTICGWVPYWGVDQTLSCTDKHLACFDEIAPFHYEVSSSCKLMNTFKGKWDKWKELFDRCKETNKPIIPTIYWTNTKAMHDILSNPKKRTSLIDQIITELHRTGFQGININFERVSPNTRMSYLAFIKELSERLHSDQLLLYCTMGGRVGDKQIALYNNWPPVARAFINPEKPSISLSPGTGEEAAIYKRMINEYCDHIIVMGYDEWGRAYTYNEENMKNKYYVSHASDQWSIAIIKYVLTFVPPKKVSLAVGTYGLEFLITHKKGDISFKKVRNIKYAVAMELAKEYKVTPKRTAGGELSFTYNKDGKEYYVCFIDAQAIRNKLQICKQLGIRGIYLFKLDGHEDPEVWTDFYAK